MSVDALHLLQLLQLADSALPIGTTAHSFGLETLVEEGYLRVESLESFLDDFLCEVGRVEVTYCRAAYRLAVTAGPEEHFIGHWLELNQQMSALKMARESRAASATLGRRFLQLVSSLEANPLLELSIRVAKTMGCDLHHSLAFGLVGGIMQTDETATALAYLQQSIMGLVSACQRLLPLGQGQASLLLWHIKPRLVTVVDESKELALEDLTMCTPLLDLCSMRHPELRTRLFIS